MSKPTISRPASRRDLEVAFAELKRWLLVAAFAVSAVAYLALP